MARTLILTQSISNGNDIEFTSGIDSTYKLYIFTIAVRITGAGGYFNFNGSIDGGSNYNVAKTTTYFNVLHKEDDSSTAFGYLTANDLAQGTGEQNIIHYVGSTGDHSDAIHVAKFYLFNPSSTTYVKHFYSTASGMTHGVEASNTFVGGYFNTTDNIDAINFDASAGQFYGDISMYGVG